MRIVFAVLIYSALSVRGRTQIINAETLAQALGWKNKLVFYFMFIKYQRAGNDLCAIIKQAISAHVRDIRNQALSVWMEDLTQTVEQIRDPWFGISPKATGSSKSLCCPRSIRLVIGKAKKYSL